MRRIVLVTCGLVAMSFAVMHLTQGGTRPAKARPTVLPPTDTFEGRLIAQYGGMFDPPTSESTAPPSIGERILEKYGLKAASDESTPPHAEVDADDNPESAGSSTVDDILRKYGLTAARGAPSPSPTETGPDDDAGRAPVSGAPLSWEPSAAREDMTPLELSGPDPSTSRAQARNGDPLSLETLSVAGGTSASRTSIRAGNTTFTHVRGSGGTLSSTQTRVGDMTFGTITEPDGTLTHTQTNRIGNTTLVSGTRGDGSSIRGSISDVGSNLRIGSFTDDHGRSSRVT